jgi:hypothetical protein
MLFFGLNLISVWLPGGVPPTIQDPIQIRNARLLASVRYTVALVIPLLYFNLNHIRVLFKKSTNEQMDKSANGQMDESVNGPD